jgi:3-hydroxybutyryl-CoA dehydrogenase
MEVKTIGVIGAGTSGPGLACLAAFYGYRTILEGVSHELLDQAAAYVRNALQEGVTNGSVTPQQKQKTLANLATSRSIEDVCREADLLIEAAQEEIEVKLEIFTLFDKFAKPAAILASSSPTISIDKLAEITFRTENCIGLRFRDPLTASGQLEIIRTAETSDATVEACREVGKRMGRELVVRGI